MTEVSISFWPEWRRPMTTLVPSLWLCEKLSQSHEFNSTTYIFVSKLVVKDNEEATMWLQRRPRANCGLTEPVIPAPTLEEIFEVFIARFEKKFELTNVYRIFDKLGCSEYPQTAETAAELWLKHCNEEQPK